MSSLELVSNPFEPEVITRDLTVGTSIRQVLLGREIEAYLNGNLVTDYDYCLCKGDRLTVFADPGEPGSFLYYVFVVVAALTAAYTAYTLLTGLPETDGEDFSPTYNLRGQTNEGRLGQPVPFSFGELRIYPDLLSRPYSEYSGNEQYLFQIFCIGLGEYDVSAIQLEDTSVASFEEVSTEVLYNSSVTLFPGNVVTSVEVANQELTTTYVGPFVVNGVGTEINRIAIDVVFPQGLWRTQQDGDVKSLLMNGHVQIQYRVYPGGGAWTTVDEVQHDALRQEPWFISYYIDVAPGRYEVQVRRTVLALDGPRWHDDLNWYSMRGYLVDDTVFTNMTVLAVRMRSSDQLSNISSRRINVLAKRKVRTRSGGSWTAPTLTRNPAWAIAATITDSWAGNRPDSALDIPSLEAFATWCTTNSFNFDGRFDKKESLWEAIGQIASVGRGFPILQYSTIGIKIEDTQSLPAWVFSRANMLNEQFSYEFEKTEDYDSIELLYYDEALSYKETILRHPVTAAATTNNPKKFDIRRGVTNRDHVYNMAQFIAGKIRYQRQRVSFETELEGYLPEKGDLIAVPTDTVGDLSIAGSILGWTVGTKTLVLSNPVKEELPVDYAIMLRKRNGDVDGPHLATVDANDPQKVILDATVTLGWDPSPVDGSPDIMFVWGELDYSFENFLVTAVNPRSDYSITVEAINYDSRVYDTSGTAPAPAIRPELPNVNDAPAILYMRLENTANPNLISVSVVAEGGWKYFFYEYSYDNSVWSPRQTSYVPHFTVPVAGSYTLYVRVAAVGVLMGPWSTVSSAVGTDYTAPYTPVTSLAATVTNYNLETSITFSWDEHLGDDSQPDSKDYFWRIKNHDGFISLSGYTGNALSQVISRSQIVAIAAGSSRNASEIIMTFEVFPVSFTGAIDFVNAINSINITAATVWTLIGIDGTPLLPYQLENDYLVGEILGGSEIPNPYFSIVTQHPVGLHTFPAYWYLHYSTGGASPEQVAFFVDAADPDKMRITNNSTAVVIQLISSAFKLAPNQKYQIVVRGKTNEVSPDASMTIRAKYITTDPTDGKVALTDLATELVDPEVQTGATDVALITAAWGTSFEIKTFDWKPPDTALWASIVIEVSNASLRTFEVDYVMVRNLATIGARLGADLYDDSGTVILADKDVRNDQIVSASLGALNFNPSFQLSRRNPSGGLAPAGWFRWNSATDEITYVDDADRDVIKHPYNSSMKMAGSALRVNPGSRYELVIMARLTTGTGNLYVGVNEYDSEIGNALRAISSDATNAEAECQAATRVALETSHAVTSAWLVATRDYSPTDSAKWFSPFCYADGESASAVLEVEWFIVRSKSTVGALNQLPYIEDFADNDLQRVLSHWSLFNDIGGEESIVAETTTPPGMGGQYVWQLGNNAGDDEVSRILSKSRAIPVETNVLYKMTYHIRRVSGSGTLTLGVAGLAADGSTWVNTLGADSTTSQHYFVASAWGPGDTGWQTRIGYFWLTGGAADIQGGVTYPSTPGVFHANVRYMVPMFFANFDNAAGQVQIGYISIERVAGNADIGTNQIEDSAVTNVVTAADGSTDIKTTYSTTWNTVLTAEVDIGVVKDTQKILVLFESDFGIEGDVFYPTMIFRVLDDTSTEVDTRYAEAACIPKALTVPIKEYRLVTLQSIATTTYTTITNISTAGLSDEGAGGLNLMSISHSSGEYSPANASSKVIWEVIAEFNYDQNLGNSATPYYVKAQQWNGSTWNDITGTERRDGSLNSTNDRYSVTPMHFLVDMADISGNATKIRFQHKCEAASQQFDLVAARVTFRATIAVPYESGVLGAYGTKGHVGWQMVVPTSDLVAGSNTITVQAAMVSAANIDEAQLNDTNVSFVVLKR